MYAYHKADPLFLKKKNTRDLFCYNKILIAERMKLVLQYMWSAMIKLYS